MPWFWLKMTNFVNISYFSITPQPGSANSEDFDGAVKDVIFKPGESGPKFVDINLIDDRNVEPTEKFTVSLSSKSSAVLGEPSDVNIEDDDGKYVL